MNKLRLRNEYYSIIKPRFTADRGAGACWWLRLRTFRNCTKFVFHVLNIILKGFTVLCLQCNTMYLF